MDGNTWVDPRYTELVEAWEQLRQLRCQRGAVRPCPSCQHGLGVILMVDQKTKTPMGTRCIVCGG